MWFFVCANLSGNHPTCLDFQLWFFALIFYVFNIIQVHQHYWNHLHFAREWVAVTFTKDSSYHRLFFFACSCFLSLSYTVISPCIAAL